MDRAEYHRSSSRLNRILIETDTVLGHIKSAWCRIVRAEFEPMEVPRHRHSLFELHFFLTGSGTATVNCGTAVSNETYLIGSGEFLLVPPMEDHAFLGIAPSSAKFVMAFSAENDGACFGRCRVLSGTRQMETIIEMMQTTAQKNDPGADYTICALAGALITDALRIACPGLFSARPQKFIQAENLADCAEQIIRDNIDRGITAEFVSNQLFLSLKQLNRLTLERRGASVSQLISKIRLDKVKQLLAGGNDTMAEIAEKTGFSSGYSLSRFFVRSQGISPGRYRREIRK